MNADDRDRSTGSSALATLFSDLEGTKSSLYGIDIYCVGDYTNTLNAEFRCVSDAQFHLSSLPPAQVALWPELGEVKAHFVLYGGTALALHLGHRQSVDFDLFTTRPFRPGDLHSSLKLLRGTEVMQSFPDTLVVLKTSEAGNVKLAFFGALNLARVRPPMASGDNGLRVASLLDLAGTKAKVLQDRAELKDYLDIAAVLRHGIGFFDMLRAAMTIYGSTFNPLASLKALAYFEDGDVYKLDGADRRLLENEAARVDLSGLSPFVADSSRLDAA